ncbi:MAG: homocysteine S-methyltransferase family protein [Paracoccaceae bacterium]
MTKVALLDGSIGQELVKRGSETPTPFWSTSVMLHHPDLLRAVHDDYVAAGATVVTTNTYAVLYDRFEQMGDLGVPVPEIVSRALEIAQAARDAAGAGRIAGALGPLMASYRPDRCPPPNEAAEMYAKSIAHLENQVDLLLFETMASVEQAEGALLAASQTNLPVWLAVTVDDYNGTRLRSGEPISELAPLVATHRPQAVLINCSRPEAITDALGVIKDMTDTFGAYANGFTEISEGFLEDAPTVDALSQRTDLGPDAYADIAMSWVDQGATIIGGCCEVGPAHIAVLADRLRAAGYEIV